MIFKFNDFSNESTDYSKFQDFGCNYISTFIEENPEYDNEEFLDYVTTNNKADRDSGELQDVSKSEIDRLAKEYNKVNEDASTTATVGSGTAVGGGATGSFVSAAGVSVSGGDSGTAFSTNSSSTGMGAIVSAQPSLIPGDVAGSSNGSGDIGQGLGTYTKLPSGGQNLDKNKKKKKKIKRTPTEIATSINNLYTANYTSKISESKIKRFDDFI